MAETQPKRTLTPMAGSTCTTCGADVEPGREGRHLFGEVQCLVCERVHLSSDLEVATAMTDAVKAVAKAALDGYASPSDVITAVTEAIAEMRTVPADTIDTVNSQLKVNTARISL